MSPSYNFKDDVTHVSFITISTCDFSHVSIFQFQRRLYPCLLLLICTCSQILSPWLGDIVDSGIELSYRPSRLHIGWRAGTITVGYNPQSGIKNLASGRHLSSFLKAWISCGHSFVLHPSILFNPSTEIGRQLFPTCFSRLYANFISLDFVAKTFRKNLSKKVTKSAKIFLISRNIKMEKTRERSKSTNFEAHHGCS